MIVFRTQVLITFLEPICKDYAKVNIMTFASLVEIPEWFSHRGEGSSLSFRLPSVSVADGNKLQALLLWVVLSASTNEATREIPFLRFDMCDATFKNKSNGMELFKTKAAVTFDRTITKQSWIQCIPLIGLEESLQGVEELEVNVRISLYVLGYCHLLAILHQVSGSTISATNGGIC